MEHPVERLWRDVESFAAYPPGIVPVSQRMERTAFFPAGSGLWETEPGKPLPAFPFGGAMFLGHNNDSKDKFDEMLLRGKDYFDTMKTWLKLTPLLDKVGIDKSCCFFTNIYMGLHERTQNTGRMKGASDLAYDEWSTRFLERQISLMRPRLIVSLGRYVPPFLARMSSGLRVWKTWPGYAALDGQGHSLVEDAEIAGVRTTVVALIHPSRRELSLRFRQFGGATGDDAEVQLLRKGMSLAGVASHPREDIVDQDS